MTLGHVLAGGARCKKARASQADLKVLLMMLEHNAMQTCLIAEATVIFIKRTKRLFSAISGGCVFAERRQMEHRTSPFIDGAATGTARHVRQAR